MSRLDENFKLANILEKREWVLRHRMEKVMLFCRWNIRTKIKRRGAQCEPASYDTHQVDVRAHSVRPYMMDQHGQIQR